MSRHTFTLAGALAGCLMFAGAAQPTEVQPLPSAKPQASPLIILAQQAEQPGVPRGAKGALRPSPMSAVAAAIGDQADVTEPG
jgi:hypothetical protein